jgi:hypothetical protein
MLFNDLLLSHNIPLEDVLVLRHRPTEPELNRIFPFLAGQRPDLFRAYESSHYEKMERSMSTLIGTGYLASFIAHGAGRAIYVGLSHIKGAKPITFDEYWKIPANLELRTLGMRGFRGERPSVLWFDLAPTEFYKDWKGKLIIEWPPPERSWWRRAHKNEFAVHAILEESAFDVAMKDWREIDLTWAQLAVLPVRWRTKLSEWRAIYYIFESQTVRGM